jgi:hypothetical protein
MQKHDSVMSEVFALIIYFYVGNFLYQKKCRKRHIDDDRDFTLYGPVYLKNIFSVEW